MLSLLSKFQFSIYNCSFALCNVEEKQINKTENYLMKLLNGNFAVYVHVSIYMSRDRMNVKLKKENDRITFPMVKIPARHDPWM